MPVQVFLEFHYGWLTFHTESYLSSYPGLVNLTFPKMFLYTLSEIQIWFIKSPIIK